nr:hypothetical protein Iba_chr12dCG9040 [Ipomoea batatas]
MSHRPSLQSHRWYTEAIHPVRGFCQLLGRVTFVKRVGAAGEDGDGIAFGLSEGGASLEIEIFRDRQVTVVAAPWILAAASSSPPSRRWAPLFYKDDMSSSGSTQQQRQVSNGEGRSSVSACGSGALYMDDDGLGRRRWWCWFSALRSA